MNTRNSKSRRQIAYVSIWGTSRLHLRNPYIIAWWSAAFPGMGHLLLSKFLRGFLLFFWEILVNIKGHINIAILYTFTGRFEMAKTVLDKRWLLLYCSLYIFAIWDSYRTTVDINNNYILAVREDAEIKPFRLSALELNYLDKKVPWISAVWSLLFPGAGQMYIHRIVMAAFTLAWWITIVYLSNVLPAIHFTLTGHFEQARAIVDPHWTLNISSVYLFSMYDAYANTVENNKLFDWEQSRFLKRDYQNVNFHIPSARTKDRGDNVHIIATFEHTIYLEKAITSIQMKGIAKEDILAVSMDKKAEQRRLFDTIHESDGLSMVDLAAIFGTIFMLLGTIYGFVLKFGPIFWGLVGLVSGFLIGLLIKLIFIKKYTDRQTDKRATEVVIIVECKEDKLEMVRETFWENHALGISKLSLGEV
jgi:TM2 domain-containing membrane protein YozV